MLRTLGLLLVILSAAMTMGGTKLATAAGDTVTPKLNSVALSSPGPFTPPDTISLSFDATDDQNVRYVVMAFTSPTGADYAFSKFSFVTGGQVTPPVQRALVFDSLQQIDFGFLPSGTYTLQYIDVSDWSSPQPNTLTCNRNGSAESSPAAATLPANPCPSTATLESLDFVIANPNGDSAAPQLTSITLPTGSYNPADSVALQVAASDGAGGSGIHSMGFSWSNTLNGGQFIVGSFNQAAGTAQVLINANTPPGTYAFNGIILRDRLQNGLTYGADGTLTKVPLGISAPTPPHGFDMSATFTVVNPNADTATPVLSSFTRTSPAVIGPGSNVNLDFGVTDAGSGLKDIMFEYDPPSGLPFVVFAQNGSGLDGNASTQLPPAYPPGNYFLALIRVIDEDGNEARYFRGGGTAGLPQGVTFPATQPPGMAAMFAQADFVAGSAAGIDLESVFPRSAQANSGQTFLLTVTGSGFSELSAVFFGPARLSTLELVGSTTIKAQVPGTLLNGAAGTISISVTNPSGFAAAGSPSVTSLLFEITEFSAADVNADGCVEVSDALAIRQSIASIGVTQVPCGPAGAANFDADRSGQPNSADALYVLKVIAGILPR